MSPPRNVQRCRTKASSDKGERPDRRQWRKKGRERVAVVQKIEDKRKPDDFLGYRNRSTEKISDF